MNVAKKLGMIFVVIAICLAMTACSTVSSTVFAESRNKYTVVATGHQSHLALNRAFKEAQTTCFKQRKEMVIVSKKTTRYEGVRRDLSATNTKIADIASATGEPTRFPNLSNEDDYESTVVFTCQGSTIKRCQYCFPVAKSRNINNGYQ